MRHGVQQLNGGCTVSTQSTRRARTSLWPRAPSETAPGWVHRRRRRRQTRGGGLASPFALRVSRVWASQAYRQAPWGRATVPRTLSASVETQKRPRRRSRAVGTRRVAQLTCHVIMITLWSSTGRYSHAWFGVHHGRGRCVASKAHVWRLRISGIDFHPLTALTPLTASGVRRGAPPGARALAHEQAESSCTEGRQRRHRGQPQGRVVRAGERTGAAAPGVHLLRLTDDAAAAAEGGVVCAVAERLHGLPSVCPAAGAAEGGRGARCAGDRVAEHPPGAA